MEFIQKVLSVTEVTHDVRCIRIEKPQGYSFVPGQATEVSVNKEGWNKKKRPFTFTSLNDDPYLEFTIKVYPERDGVTNEIGKLQAGDELIIRDVWGAIEYKGKGCFIAGGAGITPFIAILRQLYKNGELDGNMLFFSNKTSADIIYEAELNKMLGKNVVYVLTRDAESDYYTDDFIGAEFLKEYISDFNTHFYICGPDKMVNDIGKELVELGAVPDTVVFEK